MRITLSLTVLFWACYLWASRKYGVRPRLDFCHLAVAYGAVMYQTAADHRETHLHPCKKPL